MKMNNAFIFLLSFVASTSAFAQTFTDNGAKSYTMDQVGVGVTDPGNYRMYINGNTYNAGIQYFRTVAHDGDSALTHLAFPVATDGFFLTTRQLEADRMEVLFRMRDNATGDFFKIWFDDYRGESYDRYPFMVSGDQVLLASDGGNVGIGLANPGKKLDVAGSARLISSNYIDFAVERSDNNSKITMGITSGSMEGFLSSQGQIKFLTGGSATSRMYINEIGHVGIGTTTPSEKLSVNGTIRSKEVKVEAAPWPDYVFSENYDLPSLEETEAYIKAHKHLPGIPSAEEVAEEGIALGEMNAKLLEKVEEMMLYIIELEKKNRQQDEIIRELQEKLSEP